MAERLNRTLMEVEQQLLSEAVATAAYVRNRTTTKATNITPYEKWYNRKPDVTNLRVFGCVAYAHVPDALRQKLDKKARRKLQ